MINSLVNVIIIDYVELFKKIINVIIFYIFWQIPET